MAISAAATTPPVMGDVPNQAAAVGAAFSLSLATYVTATEGDAITAYAVTGTLPAGLSLDTSTGVVSGTPTAAGSSTVSFTASDDDGASNADSVTFTVSAAPVGGTMQLSVAAQTVAEADGIVTVTVTRTGGSSGPVSVAYATAPGTATSPADFAATSGVLTWADGDVSSKSFTISLVNDGLAEGNESFTVTLTDNAPTDTGGLGSPSVQTITITDSSAGTVAPVPGLGAGALILLMSLLAGLSWQAASGAPSPQRRG